jgi:alkanesulfonate monooxygenase SsuD/methylene tetrahydromethanopterin reductase-like flavin-dependent oxidoreductase (luciferase family)
VGVHPLRFGIVCGQRATYPDLRSRAEETETRGYDDFNVVDHFYGLRNVMDPTHEAYTMLAALALSTSRVRLGVMVCGNTYRNPAFLLKQAVTVDHISGGRVDFGVGAGWLEREHEAYGFDFPSAKERVDRFAEALQIWELLQSRERTLYEGKFYQLIDAPFEPKPVNGRLPLLIGSSGKRMLKMVAEHANIWNAIGPAATVGATSRILDANCTEIGRDPKEIARSISVPLQVWVSVDDFVSVIESYIEEGFTDFRIPWPRFPEEHDVFVKTATEVIPGMRKAYG